MCEGAVGEGVVRVRGEKVRDNTLHMQVMQQPIDELRGREGDHFSSLSLLPLPSSSPSLSPYPSLSLPLSLPSLSSSLLPFPPHPLPLPGMLLG